MNKHTIQLQSYVAVSDDLVGGVMIPAIKNTELNHKVFQMRCKF